MDIAELTQVLELRQEMGSFLEINNIPLELRKALTEEVPMLSCVPEKVLVARDGRARQRVFELSACLCHDACMMQ